MQAMKSDEERSTAAQCSGVDGFDEENAQYTPPPAPTQSMPENNGMTTSCAACGKGGEGLKKCTACKMVSYCNRDCQIAHRQKHKKECKWRAAELFDEKLFQQPTTPADDCPVCFLPLPVDRTLTEYMGCCGKKVCAGCVIAHSESAGLKKCCPFCRTPPSSTPHKHIERLRERMKLKDAEAFFTLGAFYRQGDLGYKWDVGVVERDSDEAFKLFFQAAELGSLCAHSRIGHAYVNGIGLKRDLMKGIHHYEVAAIGGDLVARHDLGMIDQACGYKERAMKHFMISASGGYDLSLEAIRRGFMDGIVPKDDYANALRAHKESSDELKSDQRDRAAAIRDLLKQYKGPSDEVKSDQRDRAAAIRDRLKQQG